MRGATDTGPQAAAERGLLRRRSRRSSRSPTAWAARRPARSPRGSRPRRSREGDGRRRAAPRSASSTLIQEANRRVYERRTRTRPRLGHGHDDDGRARRRRTRRRSATSATRAPTCIRDGELEQLTEDHSLVAELVRSGKLSPEEAETHPQRSVITRALGTDPDVDVDTFTVEARDGDVFLLCSDGLTAWSTTGRSSTLVEAHRGDLDARGARRSSARRTAAAARTTSPSSSSRSAATPGETTQMPAVDEPPTGRAPDDEDTLTEARRCRPARGPARGTATTTGSSRTRRPRPSTTAQRAARPAQAPLARPLVLALTGSLVLAAVVARRRSGASRRAHFVGARRDGRVAVYQGVPWDLGGGIHLYRAVYVSPLVRGAADRRPSGSGSSTTTLVSLGDAALAADARTRRRRRPMSRPQPRAR